MFISPKAPADGFLPFRKTQGLTEQGLEAPFFLLCHFYLSGERFHPFEIRQICRHVHNASVFIYFILFFKSGGFRFFSDRLLRTVETKTDRGRGGHMLLRGGGSDAASPPRARCDSRNTRHFLITAIRMHPFSVFPPHSLIFLSSSAVCFLTPLLSLPSLTSPLPVTKGSPLLCSGCLPP